METYRTVIGTAVGEYTEKHSKFIGEISHVETEKEAIAFLKSVKTKHPMARHNAYAYSLINNNTVRFSDDGEPHSTAGKPILDLISGNQLNNTLIVVTRYFGGILLGTGGLVRAYSAAAEAAINNAKIADVILCTTAEMHIDYADYDKLKFVLEKFGAVTDNTEFGNTITINVHIESNMYPNLISELNNTFFGKVVPKVIAEKFLPISK